MSQQTLNQANRRLIGKLLLMVAAMFSFGFAMVPLYDVFCDITGLNGKTANEAAVVTDSTVDRQRTVTVQFVASVNAGSPWEFTPEAATLEVNPGEFYQTYFRARNMSGQALVGQAIPSVAPGLAARHFQKIECFCFNRQDFAAGEGRDMPLVFRVDPQLDPEIRTITLSYTFFKLDDLGG